MSRLLAWQKCPWHRLGVCCFEHDGTLEVLTEVEGLRHVVRKLAGTVMWRSCGDFPVVQVAQDPQAVEVAEIGVPVPDESQPVPVERIKDRMSEEKVECHEDRIVEQSCEKLFVSSGKRSWRWCRSVLFERVQQVQRRRAGHIVDVPNPQIWD